jgi:ATP-dependent helicase HrpB
VEDARADLFGGESDSDFFVLMRAWRFAERNGFSVDRCRRLGIHAQTARQVGPLYDQFLAIAERERLDIAEKPANRDAIRKCLLVGFADHLARRLDTGTLRCALVHGRKGLLARESTVQEATLLVAAEVREVQSGTGKDRDLNVLLSLATAVNEEWLRELYPDDFSEGCLVEFDPALRRVVARRYRRFRDLVLEEKLTDDVPKDEAAKILAREIVEGRCKLNEWSDAVDQWILRLNRLAEWMPELGLPVIRDEDRGGLIEQICHGATSYKEVKDRSVWGTVKGWLSPQQQAWVDEYAPERIELPGGRRAKIHYEKTGHPKVSVKIQDLYGVNEGLWIAQRRIPLAIEILAPNQRPVQVTQNLGAFWRETYPKLKQELQRKYPKHAWR